MNENTNGIRDDRNQTGETSPAAAAFLAAMEEARSDNPKIEEE
ncbi:hypothetical protein QWJ41_04195 [Nocardioides sp. SOB44]|uniref:Uncharacterized protein n=1 Tax=Nocardioides cremeus TaxID=3058044 RepID=A0ABT8TRG6_9ACTN|nr:hypothetical protein [Nocardioides cremeus]MDO3394907.1 hypothetical protein [Nocardioides cremeus]